MYRVKVEYCPSRRAYDVYVYLAERLCQANGEVNRDEMSRGAPTFTISDHAAQQLVTALVNLGACGEIKPAVSRRIADLRKLLDVIEGALE